MIRPLALGMVLLLQFAASLAPGGVVLCVHDDGHWFLESAANPCCRACPRAERGPDASRTGCPAVAQDRGAGGDDHCQDFLLGAPEARTPVPKAAPVDGGRSGERIGPAPAMETATVLPVVLPPGDGIRGPGPPRPPGVLALLRTVLLRC